MKELIATSTDVVEDRDGSSFVNQVLNLSLRSETEISAFLSTLALVSVVSADDCECLDAFLFAVAFFGTRSSTNFRKRRNPDSTPGKTFNKLGFFMKIPNMAGFSSSTISSCRSMAV